MGRKPICRPLFLANRRLDDDDDAVEEIGGVVCVMRKALAFARRHSAVTVMQCFIVLVSVVERCGRESFPPRSH
jgi:hypothetical protein